MHLVKNLEFHEMGRVISTLVQRLEQFRQIHMLAHFCLLSLEGKVNINASFSYIIKARNYLNTMQYNEIL